MKDSVLLALGPLVLPLSIGSGGATALAAPGDIDPSFGTAGITATAAGPLSMAFALAVQQRLPNGDPDPSFTAPVSITSVAALHVLLHTRHVRWSRHLRTRRAGAGRRVHAVDAATAGEIADQGQCRRRKGSALVGVAQKGRSTLP